MNLQRRHTAKGFEGRRKQPQGFTLTQFLVSMAVFLLVVTGAVSSHLFGLKMFEITQTKLEAGDQSRRLMNYLNADIRSAYNLQIGQGTLSAFTRVADNLPQQGNAIQIYPSTNSSAYVRYFRDTVDASLKRTVTGDPKVLTLADSITNQVVFSAEDYAGNVLTNSQNRCVIGLNLKFFGFKYTGAATDAGTNSNSYQFKAKITRRSLE